MNHKRLGKSSISRGVRGRSAAEFSSYSAEISDCGRATARAKTYTSDASSSTLDTHVCSGIFNCTCEP